MGDWNGDAKTAVTTAAGMIPEAGGVLAGLAQIFWPGNAPIWGSQDQIEQLIGQALDQDTYDNVHDTLDGLQTNMNVYLQYLNEGDSAASEALKARLKRVS